MILRGGHKAIAKSDVVICSDVLCVNMTDLRTEIESYVREGKVPVINCVGVGKSVGESNRVETCGLAALRWGRPMILLLRPDQARLAMSGVQLFTSWKLWANKFDSDQHAFVCGSPTRAENLIRKNIEIGLDWGLGFMPEDDVGA